jgi:hypothetical protein
VVGINGHAVAKTDAPAGLCGDTVSRDDDPKRSITSRISFSVDSSIFRARKSAPVQSNQNPRERSLSSLMRPHQAPLMLVNSPENLTVEGTRLLHPARYRKALFSVTSLAFCPPECQVVLHLSPLKSIRGPRHFEQRPLAPSATCAHIIPWRSYPAPALSPAPRCPISRRPRGLRPFP